MRKDWKGDIAFAGNMAIFRGYVGDNKPHRHWASQITIALEGEVNFKTPTGVFNSKAVYFSSKTEHCLLSGFVCSIYCDPLADSILKTLKKETPDGWAPLTYEELPQELSSITGTTSLRDLMAADLLNPQGLNFSSDERFRKVIREIKSQLSQGNNIGRDYLANLTHLSPTRFSHWFVEKSGVPLRSYKKWLKLKIAMEALLNGSGPMQAAMLAGFSDQAHMSREFSDSFGLTYLDAKRAWDHTQKT